MISTVLFDLDGVIRHFDVDDVADIERRHGLALGVLEGSAFSQPLLTEVTTGRITRDEWVRRIGERVRSTEAAEEWSSRLPTVDAEMLDLADELRALGLRVAVLTNGTDTIASEVAESGIDGHYDAIFNSADIGFVKPDVRAFEHVLHALDCDGPQVFFADDSESKLSGARTLGLTTHLFTGIRTLRADLARAGVAVDPARI
ncbi:HAD-IA family hydrolase [Rhodococcoides yunnanense]|uniref:HAD-IA family hydrolase n=1 Tax=Rhodococcoides yunnanense TaxID=278209 RepID=UPI000935167E|nr:HAD-IA family hydrolase [Rhodococcus yunnanensis]